MSLTSVQIAEIRRRGLAKGLSEGQITKGITQINQQAVRKQIAQSENGSSSSINTQNSSNVTPVTSPNASQQPQGSIVGEFFKKLFVEPTVNYGKFVGEGVTAMNKIKANPIAYGKGIVGAELSPEEADLIVGESKNTFLKPEQTKDAASIIKTGAKSTAGALALVAPGGKSVPAILALGAGSGALSAFADGDNIDVDKIVLGSIVGAGTAGVLKGGGTLLGKGLSAAKGGIKNLIGGGLTKLSDEASSRINKASPSAWQKALEDHGLDLNKLTEKYFPKGGTYDDLLGSTKDRGFGGNLGKIVKTAEDQIKKAFKGANSNTKLPIDDFVAALQKEKEVLARLPGNEGNIAALDQFVQAFQKKYGKGISPQRLLEIKRTADSRFGVSVTDENTGSAISQAQKMVANAARVKLKELFPAVKDALDTETEIYTLLPVMNRARAILNTQGSTIRVGQLGGKSLWELLNPFTIGDVYLSDPSRASKFLRKTASENPALSSSTKSNLFSSRFPAGAAGVAALNTVSQKPPKTEAQGQNPENNINTENSNNEMGQSDFTISDAEEKAQRPFGGRSKKELLLMAISQGATKKDLTEIADIYDMVMQEDAKDLELSDSAIKSVNDLKGALSDIESLSTSISSKELTGPIRGKISAANPYDIESKNLQSEIDRVRQVVGKALEGGVLRKEDEEKYKKILPTMEDPKEVALQKLVNLKKKIKLDLDSYVGLQRDYGKGRGAENILSTTTQ